MIKAPKKQGIEGMYLNIINAIYNKHMANIVLNEAKLKLLPLESERRQGCSFSQFLFNIVLSFLARTIRQEKERKGITNRKGRRQIVPICK
jgi:hypothetical protein